MPPLRRRLSKPVVRLSVLMAVLSVLLGFVCYMVWSDREDLERDQWRITWWDVNRGDTEEVRTMLQRKEISQEDLSEMLLMSAENDLDDSAITTLLALKVNLQAQNAQGQTALQIARRHHHTGKALLLQQAGAKE